MTDPTPELDAVRAAARDRIDGLMAGAAQSGTLNVRAAIWLLTYIEDLMYADSVEAHLTPTGRAGGLYIPDWNALADDKAIGYLGGGAYRLFTLARSFARGEPVDLRSEISNSLGKHYATRVLEAVALATGLAEKGAPGPERWPWW